MNNLKETLKNYRNAYRLINEIEKGLIKLICHLLDLTKYAGEPYFYPFHYSLNKENEIKLWPSKYGWDFLSAYVGQYYKSTKKIGNEYDTIPEFSILIVSDTALFQVEEEERGDALNFIDSDKTDSLLVFLYCLNTNHRNLKLKSNIGKANVENNEFRRKFEMFLSNKEEHQVFFEHS